MATSGIDYNNHRLENIKFIPPDNLLPHWEERLSGYDINYVLPTTIFLCRTDKPTD
jgi:hypothetical protein